jgi:wyosine [tRNA(Phe)-imidazoG37] synthetase (radical SAM superfamily)
MITFGPVPSRRLGRSLGINNIPPKSCSNSCVYCQVGNAGGPCLRRRTFWPTAAVTAAVRARVAACRAVGAPVDYLTIVPDGEPTLDANLGRTIRSLRSLGIPIAVISNGTLLGREDVRQDLAAADWVSLKVDAVREVTWRRINRPHAGLQHRSVLHGVRDFARIFTGKLATETMLVAGVNDDKDDLLAVAAFVADLGPACAYLAVPTRPPAEYWVRPAAAESIALAYAIFREARIRTELLVGYEGDAFASTGDVRQDLLAITAVHPMRERAVRRLIVDRGAAWSLVEELVRQGRLIAVTYARHRYYLRPTPESVTPDFVS